MKTINNLDEARKLKKGEHCYYGNYCGEQVEYMKADKYHLLAVNALDSKNMYPEIGISINKNYFDSSLMDWCNDFGSNCNIEKGVVTIPDNAKLKKWLGDRNKQRAVATENAIDNGVYKSKSNDYVPYYVKNFSSDEVLIMNENGIIDEEIYNCGVGIRPVIELYRNKTIKNIRTILDIFVYGKFYNFLLGMFAIILGCCAFEDAIKNLIGNLSIHSVIFLISAIVNIIVGQTVLVRFWLFTLKNNKKKKM